MCQGRGPLTKMIIAVIPVDRILHLCASDWLRDTKDLHLDRGMPSDGLIENPRICTWMEEIGFKGDVEVEIFSNEDRWKCDCNDFVKRIIPRIKEIL